MTFYVGQKVVCVDAYGSNNLTVNDVYTVRRVIEGFGLWRGASSRVGLLLVETSPNPENDYFASARFRPIVDNKSSVSFTTGADPESERFDNRKTKERVR